MFNVNELTSRLAEMSDQQLRQYAQLHKSDPYTLALAASESKRRAQLRAAGQQQAGMGKPPTVADQAIAQMSAPAPMPQPQLPEQQGIGMLPAQNVATMADGGIAGYDDQFVDSYADAYAGGGIVAFGHGGGVPGYADGVLVGQGFRQDQMIPAPRPSNVFANRMAEESAQDVAAEITKMQNIIDSTPSGPQRVFAEQRLAQLRSKTKAPVLEQYNAPAPVEKPAGWAVEGKKKGEPSAVPAPIDEGNVYTGRSTAPPFNLGKTTTKNPFETRTGPGVGRTTTAQPSAEKTPDFVPATPGDLTAELKRLQSMNPGTKAYDDLSAKIKQGYADLEKAREEGKPKDKAYAGLESLLGKEEEKAKGKEAQNFNMALINAGLAIAGGKSHYALQNIAEGAQVGTKQYQEGMDKLEAAALERRKQSAMIEEARRAEARGDWKDAQQFKQKAFEADLGIKQAQIAAVQDLYKTDLKTASDFVNNQNTLASADRRALMQQQHEDIRAREQNIAHLQGQRLMAAAYGSRADQRGQITPSLVLKEYNDNLAKDTYGDFQKKYPTPQHYMAAIQQMMNPTVISELPQNANVRK